MIPKPVQFSTGALNSSPQAELPIGTITEMKNFMTRELSSLLRMRSFKTLITKNQRRELQREQGRSNLPRKKLPRRRDKLRNKRRRNNA
jgi:hypothetical protein